MAEFLSNHVVLAYGVGILLIYFVGRLLFLPAKLAFKLVYNGIIGGMLLWVVNFFGTYISFQLEMTILNALIAGFFGIPGVVGLILYTVFGAK